MFIKYKRVSWVEFPVALKPDFLPDYTGCRKSEVTWENTTTAERQRKAQISPSVEKGDN